jgi:NAD(P)H-dependent FMN reductase
MVEIGIIVGSTREGRFGIQPATWLYEIARQRGDANVHLLDLRDYPLPHFGEPAPANARTDEWRAVIDRLDGFLIVTPEYNHSTSGVLKNAIDVAGQGWFHKPASFASYGGVAGGTRAVEHLRGIMGEVRVFDLREQFVMSNVHVRRDTGGNYAFSDAEVTAANVVLDQLIFWSRHMKPARAELNG